MKFVAAQYEMDEKARSPVRIFILIDNTLTDYYILEYCNLKSQAISVKRIGRRELKLTQSCVKITLC